MQALVVEGGAGDDVDVAGDRLGGHVRRHRLAHDHLGGNRRRDRVKARIATFRRDDVDPVERQGGPVKRRTTQVDVTGLALVALHSNAGQAGHGLGDVLVGQTADGVSRQHADQLVAVLLHQQRGAFRFADRALTRNDDLAIGGGGGFASARAGGGGLIAASLIGSSHHLCHGGRAGQAGKQSEAKCGSAASRRAEDHDKAPLCRTRCSADIEALTSPGYGMVTVR